MVLLGVPIYSILAMTRYFPETGAVNTPLEKDPEVSKSLVANGIRVSDVVIDVPAGFIYLHATVTSLVIVAGSERRSKATHSATFKVTLAESCLICTASVSPAFN